MPPTDRQLREAIADVRDPCSVMNRTGLSLEDLGLVERVHRDASGHVTVDLLLTEPTCLYYFHMARDITAVLGRLPGVSGVTVNSLTDRLWEPDRMRPEARARVDDARRRRAARLGIVPTGSAEPPGARGA
jgi:metal-sulfur cluster biosynthetic enzyme